MHDLAVFHIRLGCVRKVTCGLKVEANKITEPHGDQNTYYLKWDSRGGDDYWHVELLVQPLGEDLKIGIHMYLLHSMRRTVEWSKEGRELLKRSTTANY